MNLIEYITDPIRIAILIANVIFWMQAYWYFKKTKEEYGKWWRRGYRSGKKERGAINIAVIGEPKAGKTTLIAGLERALKRRNFYGESVRVAEGKTHEIHYYAFKRIKGKRDNIAKAGDIINIADFAGEIRSNVNLDEGKVKFNASQVKELKDADIIIHLIYFKDDVNDIKRQIDMYFSAIKKALGMMDSGKKYITAEKSYIAIASHIDECKKNIQQQSD